MGYISNIVQSISNVFYYSEQNEQANENESSIPYKLLNVAKKCLFCAAFLPTLTNKSLWVWGQKIIDATGICPSSLLPNGTTNFFAKYINYPTILVPYSPKNDQVFECIIIPIFEEIVDRVLIQEIALKRAPEKILQKITPTMAPVTNHCIAKIARVCTSALFFALHHSWSHTCKNGDMYPFLMAGVLLGTMQEMFGHPLYNIITHMAANFLIKKRAGL